MAEVMNHTQFEKITPAQPADRSNDSAASIAVDSWKGRESATKIKPVDNEENLKCLSFKDNVYQSKCGFPSSIEGKPEALKPDHANGSIDKLNKKIPHDGGLKDPGFIAKVPSDGGLKDPGFIAKVPSDVEPKEKLSNLPKASGY